MMVRVTKMPGMTPPMSNCPMLTSAMIPYSTSAMLGGMSMASVPEIATTPAANCGL